jgi:hypothetical protein
MDQAQAMMPQARVASLMKKDFDGAAGEFRPCAYFDEALDCIRVISRDCSVMETRVSPLLTVLEDNYANPSKGRELYVGFTIKGVRHFCQQHGIDLNVPVKLTELLDKILEESPEPFVRMAVNEVARPLVEKDKELQEGVTLKAA